MCVCICKYMCNYFSLCVGSKYFLFVKKKKKKKKKKKFTLHSAFEHTLYVRT
jgi:hypothetical protein